MSRSSPLPPLVRHLISSVVAAVVTAAGIGVFYTAPVMAWTDSMGLVHELPGVLARMAIAAAVGSLAGVLVAAGLVRGPERERTALRALLQDGAAPADDSGESTPDPSGTPVLIDLAARAADSARRGRDASGQLVRFELTVAELARAVRDQPTGGLAPLVVAGEATALEKSLIDSVNGLIAASQGHRETTGMLLAEVEDHLVPVLESLDDLERLLGTNGSESFANDERRQRLSRVRNAVRLVERELSAVRLRMGGGPVEQLTEADILGPGDEDGG